MKTMRTEGRLARARAPFPAAARPTPAGRGQGSGDCEVGDGLKGPGATSPSTNPSVLPALPPPRGGRARGSGEGGPRAQRLATEAILAALLLAPSLALAQDASVATDASRPAAPAPARAAGECVADPLPADHAPAIEVTVNPPNPQVGDRVRVTWTFRYRTHDRVEFEPDAVALQQPAIELEYAREQPERDRSVHGERDGRLRSEVTVALQPFRSGDVVIRPMNARVNTGDEIARVCTPEVRFRVRSVFGNTSHPQARDITRPEDVRRDALTLRWISLGLDALFVAVVAALSVAAWLRRRPKVVPPPPPPRHPYFIAREALEVLSRGDLLARGLTKDYYDAVSDVVRRYLGGVRGFDAIEMTTDEILAHLRKHPLAGVTQVEVENLLRECDLVKFARYVPAHEDSDAILASAVSLVERGRPTMATAQEASRGGEP